MMDISIPYYEDLTRISNSNIGWFLQKGPAFLHKMLTDPPPEEKNYVLERGTMIHCYLLQPEEFQKTYVVWDKSRPSSAQQEKFCQELANTLEIEPNRAILSAYQAAYSTKGKSEETMLSEGLKIASTLKDYIDFLKLNDGRIMISPYDAQMLENIKQNVQSHKLAKELVWPLGQKSPYSIDGIMNQIKSIEFNSTTNRMCFHEFHINWEAGYGIIDLTEFYPVKCKSLLDSLTLDFKHKKVTIMDLKTTQKLWHFEDSIEQYDYLRQLCYYTRAVEWYMENELNISPREQLNWTFEYYIIGIDTTGSNEIRVFKIEEDAVESRDNVICDAMHEIAWHQRENKWEHSRAYYTGDGSEPLNL